MYILYADTYIIYAYLFFNIKIIKFLRHFME